MSTTRPATPRVGVREVALAAGVSSQTVSRVLNGHPHIRDSTRQRVLEAVDALGYRMNNVARAFGSRSTRTIGVIASDAALYGPSSGIAALAEAAKDAGRWIATAYADGDDPGAVAAAAERLLSQGVDGIVMVAAHNRTLDAVVEAGRDVPVRLLHAGSGAARQGEAAALAVEHLADRGHRRIAELAGPADWLEAASRSEGVARVAAARGCAVVARWRGDWSAESGSAVAGIVADAVRAADGPTAVVVANDQMALGLMAGLRARGVDVPGDLSVTGFDDNPDAAFYRPALTTVRPDTPGEARRVIAEIVGAEAKALPPAAPVLVVRDSVASLA
jgi:DNA-binding LacI/PurR family transcriptional regulator